MDSIKDVCLLSLLEEDDFSFDLDSHGLFSLDAKKVKEDSFEDIPKFLPSTIELKPLPYYLNAAFLGPNETLPVILSSLLSLEQEHALLKILSSHK